MITYERQDVLRARYADSPDGALPALLPALRERAARLGLRGCGTESGGRANAAGSSPGGKL
jgi:hypothetical protein